MAERILMNEYKALAKEEWVNIDLQEEDIFKWTVGLIVLNPDSLYYGGYFKASMTFPKNYPYSPPEFRFLRSLHHPNIYPDGKLCISILHPPGHDELSGEHASERWSPAQRVESVLISILSLLDDPEVNSPANVDAGKELRKQPDAYKVRVGKDVEESKRDIPEGFVMPTHESSMRKMAAAKIDDENFWADSGDDEDDAFGGSDSDTDMEFDDDDEGGSLSDEED